MSHVPRTMDRAQAVNRPDSNILAPTNFYSPHPLRFNALASSFHGEKPIEPVQGQTSNTSNDILEWNGEYGPPAGEYGLSSPTNTAPSTKGDNVNERPPDANRMKKGQNNHEWRFGLDGDLLAGIGHMHQTLDLDTVSIIEPEDAESDLYLIRPVEVVKGGFRQECDRVLPQLYGRGKDQEDELHRIRHLGLTEAANCSESLPTLTDEASTICSELSDESTYLHGPCTLNAPPIDSARRRLRNSPPKDATFTTHDESIPPRDAVAFKDGPKQRLSKIPPDPQVCKTDHETDMQTVNATAASRKSSGGLASGLRHRPKGKQRAKRRRSEDNSDDEEKHGEDPMPKKPKNDIARILACPYFRYDPVKHVDCLFKYTLTTTSYVKQHLHRYHACPDFYCPTCGAAFETQLEGDSHIRARLCLENGFRGFPDCLSADQVVQLQSKDGRRLPEAERWHNIWKICFPQESANRPSPYIDDLRIVELYNSVQAVLPAEFWRPRAITRMRQTGLVLNEEHFDQVVDIFQEERLAALIAFANRLNDVAEASMQNTNPAGNRAMAADDSGGERVLHDHSGLVAPIPLVPTMIISQPKPDWSMDFSGTDHPHVASASNDSVSLFTLSVSSGSGSYVDVSSIDESSHFDDSFPPHAPSGYDDAGNSCQEFGSLPSHGDCGAA
ncbi:hypothetical protein CkaCkLH20_09503 [Colletotrichum karsti]|uniref:C2H2-type domain-containing protein n=1 Tax=Colletotrichum karsti TaxID=1095194 RepID=A0A9P6HWX2_9PEZI|nr:uncharacterized protein CkaCkLH20_09503 [Colletotrichum karsti]KAF9872993.1 hypothetical protein CkaCkLH20_09503 [Colletotrichum karsti]